MRGGDESSPPRILGAEGRRRRPVLRREASRQAAIRVFPAQTRTHAVRVELSVSIEWHQSLLTPWYPPMIPLVVVDGCEAVALESLCLSRTVLIRATVNRGH